MNIICNFVLIVLSASLTGAIFTIMWIILEKFFSKFFKPDILCVALKCVAISYFIPGMVIVSVIKSYFISGLENYSLNYTKFMRVVLCSLFAVMLVMTLIRAVKLIVNYRRLKAITRLRFFAKVDTVKVVDELRKELGIKRKFNVYESMLVSTPFIHGFIRPEIYITAERFTEEELRMSLIHELFHYKQKDVIFIPLLNVIRCLHWFNPLAWYTAKELKLWTEIGCDYKCYTKGGINVQKYFGFIVEFLMNSDGDYIDAPLMIAKKEKQVVTRIMTMNKYFKSKVNKGLVFMIMLAALMLNGTIVYAATSVIEKGFNQIFIVSSKEYEEQEYLCEDGYTEYVINEKYNKNDLELVEVFSYVDGNIDSEYTDTMIDTKVGGYKNNIAVVSNVSSKGKITVVLSSEGDSRTMIVGIIEPDGTERYIEGYPTIIHSFIVDENGDYIVYIEKHDNDEQVIKGSVIYEQE